MIVYQYLGGLPKGAERDDVEVRLVDCCLHFAHDPTRRQHRHGQRHPWSYDLHLADVSDIRVDPAAQQMVITAEVNGSPASVVLQGKPVELSRLRQEALLARARTEERES